MDGGVGWGGGDASCPLPSPPTRPRPYDSHPPCRGRRGQSSVRSRSAARCRRRWKCAPGCTGAPPPSPWCDAPSPPAPPAAEGSKPEGRQHTADTVGSVTRDRRLTPPRLPHTCTPEHLPASPRPRPRPRPPLPSPPPTLSRACTWALMSACVTGHITVSHSLSRTYTSM